MLSEQFPTLFAQSNAFLQRMKLEYVPFETENGIQYYKRRNIKAPEGRWNSGFGCVNKFSELQAQRPETIDKVFELLHERLVIEERKANGKGSKEDQIKWREIQNEYYDIVKKLWIELVPERAENVILNADEWIYFLRAQRGYHLYFI